MSNRTVAVVLKAQVDDYVKNMNAAARHTTDVEKAARSATEQLRKHNESLTMIGTGMVAIGAAAAVGLGVAVKASTEFGGKMAQLQTLAHATSDQMKELSDAAMTQGKAFGYSASQVADAQIELQKAGIGVQEQLGGALQGALALAAAGQIDVADATSIAVQAMTQFGLSAKDVPHVADQLASAADSSVGSVDSIGQSLNQAGLVAHQFGWSLEETVGTLTAFSQAGLNGSDGGTSLKTALLALATPTAQQTKAMKELGISVFDAQGNFVSATELADQLQKGLGKVDQQSRLSALGIIFGSDAARAAGVAYDQGAKGIQKYIDGNDRAGFAAEQAAGKLNSLQGDLQKLDAAFQTALIKSGSAADGGLRKTVQEVTGVVEVLGDIPQPLMAVGLAGTAVVAVVGLLGGAALVAVPKIVAMRGALDELGISGRKAAGVFAKGAGLATGLTLIAAGLGGLAQKGTADAQQVALAGERIKKGWDGVDKLFDNGAVSNFINGFSDMRGALGAVSAPLGAGNATKFIDSFTLGITHFSDTYKSAEAQFDAMGQQLATLAQTDYGAASTSFATLVSKYHLGSDEVAALLKEMPAYRDELIKQAEAAGVSASDHNLLLAAQQKGKVGARLLAQAQADAAQATADQQAGIDRLAGSASSAEGDVKALSDAIAGFGSVTLDARAAQRDFRKAVQDAKDAVSDSTKSDDDKQAALDGIARAGIASAAALAKTPDGAEKARDAMTKARRSFIDVAAEMLGSRTAARRLADQLGLIPANVPIDVKMIGAEEAARKAKELVDGLPRYFYLEPRIRDGSVTPGPPSSIAAPGHAAGGPITGPGPKGKDSILAWLAPGEHVLTAGEVDRMGGQGAVSAFRADLMAGMQAFASGGAVNAISQQTQAAAKAQQDADDYQRRLKVAKDRADDASKAADRAQKTYEDTDGGKKNAAAKKAAKEAASAAKKASDDADKHVEDLRKKRDDARQKVSDANDAAAQLRNDREDFVSAERRDPTRAATDPLSYVDQLRQMSRDDNYSAADRAKFKQQANDYERSLSDMTKAAATAAQKLDDLQQASDSMRDSISSSIAGGYSLAGAAAAAGSASSTSDWFTRDGIRYQQTTTGGAATAASIAGYFAAGATNSDQFATALQQLAARGVNSTLLAQLAGMGTSDGLPIANAILAGSDGDLAGLNQGFSALQIQAGRAGQIVADANYAAQIAAADANAKSITDQLASDGLKLRHLIAQAFNLPGYATGTIAATQGLHWVGERGPELVGLRAGTPVGTAQDSARWVRGGSAGAAPQPIIVKAPAVNFPDTLILRDESGLEVKMRVVAREEIASDAAQDAVLMMGSGAA